MSPLTPWHYLLLVGFGLLFVAGVVYAARSKSKISIFITVTLGISFLGLFLWHSINENVYKVEVSNLSDERFYQSEQILIKGIVRNVGDYPVKNVKALIKLSNAKGSETKASQFSQPSAFEELFKDDDPGYKRQNVLAEHVIADHLNPGGSKSFSIIMEYPPHFTSASYAVEAKAD